MKPGRDLDRLVARKLFISDETKPYSTCPDAASLITLKLGMEGFHFKYDETDGVVLRLSHDDGKEHATAFGETYEEAVCRGALKLYGSDPA